MTKSPILLPLNFGDSREDFIRKHISGSFFGDPNFWPTSSAAQWRSEKTDGEWQPLRWVHGSGAVPDTTDLYLREYYRVHIGGSKVRIGGEIAKILDAKHWTPSNTLGTDRWLAIGLRWGGDTAEFLTGAALMTH